MMDQTGEFVYRAFFVYSKFRNRPNLILFLVFSELNEILFMPPFDIPGKVFGV